MTPARQPEGPTSTPQPWWRAPLPEVRRSLGTSDAPMSQAEADVRRTRYGPNVLRPAREKRLLIEFARRFRNPLVLILLAASAVSGVTGDVTSAFIVTLIVMMSVTLDFIQEHRAARAAERLRESVTLRTTVIRAEGARELPAAELVPGDVVQLSAGDLVPADARVLEANDFFVNQALLTGEPYPVEKGPRGAETADTPGACPAAVFMGTSVISGSARILICRIGPSTQLGEIADAVAAEPPPTAFEHGTRHFGLLILRLTVFLVLFVVLVNALHHRPVLESFLFAVALAVGLTPELLPMVVSVTLARGAQRMAARQTIVKRLTAIHDLGSMDVLCTDKTGTLTEARIVLERHVNAEGEETHRVLELAHLNSWFETGLRSTLDEAILRHESVDVSAWRKIDEVPFDFERRRVSVLLDDGNRRVMVVKGAPEDILSLCDAYEQAPWQAKALDPSSRERIAGLFHRLGEEGFRVLGVAFREVERERDHARMDDEIRMVFAGFAAFRDPPKASAAPLVAALTRQGVALKVVTGDDERVTEHVCRAVGIPVQGVLSGADVAAMDEPALRAAVEKTNLFCRVTPTQKNRIVLALQARGHVVGYLGDGINDAPPLGTADVGISVDSAVDVAKEAADLILLKSDLAVLFDGVMEGRRTFGNIMKYVMMGTSSNFGNMFSMAGAAVFLPFLPLLPVQILLNNILYDLSEVPIPLDRVDAGELAAPRRWDMTFIRNFMLVLGPVSSAFDFLTFYVMLAVLQAGEGLFRTGWFVESLATQVLVIFVIRTRGNPLKSLPHPLLITTSLAVVTLAAVLPLTPLGAYFGFVAPPAEFYLILAGLVACYLGTAELAKRMFYRRASP